MGYRYRNYSKTKRPDFIPGAPQKKYKNKGWKNWSDWLGYTGYIRGEWLEYEKAKEFAQKLNFKNIVNILKDVRNYVFPIKKITSRFKSINSKQDLQKFIQQRSAHITQNTLYGYLKTRMGHKYTIMVDDDVYSKSINIAKWNIYMASLVDLTFYVSSYLINEKNLKENNSKEFSITY